MKFCWNNHTRAYQYANCHSVRVAGQDVPVRNSVTVWGRKMLTIQVCHTSGNEGLELTTVCSTRYRTRHFFNNSNTNEDIATKFEQEHVRCVRNEKNVSVVRLIVATR